MRLYSIGLLDLGQGQPVVHFSNVWPQACVSQRPCGTHPPPSSARNGLCPITQTWNKDQRGSMFAVKHDMLWWIADLHEGPFCLRVWRLIFLLHQYLKIFHSSTTMSCVNENITVFKWVVASCLGGLKPPYIHSFIQNIHSDISHSHTAFSHSNIHSKTCVPKINVENYYNC